MLKFIRDPENRSEDKDFEVRDLEFIANISYETLEHNLKAAMARTDARWLESFEPHDGTAIIAGGGPSLKSDLCFMKFCQASGDILFAVNNVPAYLSDKGITPDCHVLLDSLPGVANMVKPEIPMVRFYSSQCDPSVHDKAPNCILWTPYIVGLETAFPELRPPFVGGGTTIGTRALGLAYQLGYRRFRLFGLDCSMDGNELHAYEQDHDHEILDVMCGGKNFRSPIQMIAQAEEFVVIIPKLLSEGCELTVYGNGLLRAVADEFAAAHEKQMN
jgi:hypothetical protein